MTSEDIPLILLSGAIALFAVFLIWPVSHEATVLDRMAEGDTGPEIFYGVPDHIVAQFTQYEVAEGEELDPEYAAFQSQVRQSAQQVLKERSRVASQ